MNQDNRDAEEHLGWFSFLILLICLLIWMIALVSLDFCGTFTTCKPQIHCNQNSQWCDFWASDNKCNSVFLVLSMEHCNSWTTSVTHGFQLLWGIFLLWPFGRTLKSQHQKTGQVRMNIHSSMRERTKSPRLINRNKRKKSVTICWECQLWRKTRLLFSLFLFFPLSLWQVKIQ